MLSLNIIILVSHADIAVTTDVCSVTLFYKCHILAINKVNLFKCIYIDFKAISESCLKETIYFIQLKGGGTKGSLPETKRVAQNTYSIKFSALQTPRKIQNLFLNRALIP